MKIPESFIIESSNIIGDTDIGLSGPKIAKYMSSYALEYNIDIPFSSYPFPSDIPNKRTALYKNLLKFSNYQQYRIIKDLCELLELESNTKVQNLKIKLIERFGNEYVGDEEQTVSNEVIDDTTLWLLEFPKAKKEYESAVYKLKNNLFGRNLVDDLRLALELLLKDIFKNNKSLENQINQLGFFLKDKIISSELRNMLVKLLQYYTDYQNSNIKHTNNYNEKEVEFIFELTSSLMKLLIRLK